MPSAFIHQRILEDPANTGGIRTEHRCYPLWKTSRRDLIEIFQDATSRPIDIGPVLKDDVNIGVTKIGKAAHKLDFGCGEHRRGNGLGHLILDDAGISAHPGGVNDHLNVRKIGNRIQRSVPQSPDAPRTKEKNHEENEKLISS